MADRNPQLSPAALLARRTTMRPDLNRITQLAALPWADAVTSLIEAPVPFPQAGLTSDSDQLLVWWTGQLTSPQTGLHERMTFFWHTLLTTNRWAVGGKYELLTLQLNLLRANALGNFRTLLQGFVIDGALMRFLNADSSTAEKPNENLARELMELFTTGIGHYTEADVRAAALAMTGWRVNDDELRVYLDPERANTAPVTFLGETKNWTVTSIVDRLCDHPATAARIASKIWYHFVGTDLGDRAGELGAWWQAQNLEIKPLLQRILNDPEMQANHYTRPRSGFEYYVALQAVIPFELSEIWRPNLLGQCLYQPPNVAGWPVGDRWLDPDSMLRRCGQIFSFDLEKYPELVTATVDQMLDRCGIYVVSDTTLEAINSAGAGQTFDEESLAQLRWRIALTSPEFQLT